MISLAVKYKCKFTGNSPPTPPHKHSHALTHTHSRQNPWLECIIMLLGRGERSIFKRKYIKSKTDLFHFLSAARLCHTLIHLSLRSVMHVDSSAAAPAQAPLGTSARISPRKKNKQTQKETQKQPLVPESREGSRGEKTSKTECCCLIISVRWWGAGRGGRI